MHWISVPGEGASPQWLDHPPRSDARLRLFCFPYSGGGSGAFAGWKDAFPAWVDVLPVRLPGRPPRQAEEPMSSMSDLVDAAIDGLHPYLGRRFAFFGHSMGGLLAYEIATQLRERHGREPEALFVSGLLPPHRHASPRVHEQSDAELARTVADLGGVPEPVRGQPELLKAMLPVLRADTTAVSTYAFTATEPLHCRISAFYGTDDPVAGADGMDSWQELTTAPASVHEIPGDHFYLRSQLSLLARLILEGLPPSAAAPAAPRPPRSRGPARTVRAIPIAVVGIGCRFPGIDGPGQMWQLLTGRSTVVGEVPDDRLDQPVRVPSSDAIKRTSRHGAFIEDLSGFDAEFFGISPREATRMDPQQRMLLEVAWHALEDAQIPAERLAGSRTCVYVGQVSGEYWEMQARDADIDLYALTGGGLRSFLAARISYALDLRGPSVAVDTACSSSLTAVHLACQDLRSGQSDTALACGVNLILRPEPSVAYAGAGVLSPRGQSNFADARADGYVRADGAAVVLLKRLDAAIADGDPVRALILGSTASNDGRAAQSIVTPSQQNQEQMLRDAIASAGIASSQIAYVEAHGTGTQVGDAVELRALAAVLGEDRDGRPPCLVGSVKGNLGHSEAAAGVTSLIKAVLSIQHRQVPPVAALGQLSGALDWGQSPLRVATELASWPAGYEQALATVSSFGLSGSNACVVVGEPPKAPRKEPDATGLPPDGRGMLLPVSARSAGALRALAISYAQALETADDPRALCAAAARGRSHHPLRLAACAGDGGELTGRLRSLLCAEPGDPLPGDSGGMATPRLAFVFPGQGAQWIGMGRELLKSSPDFRGAVDECAAAIAAEAGWDLCELLASDDPARWGESAVIQPALWAMQVALARLWQARGLSPEVVIGHSMGEIAAAVTAGALSVADAAKVICHRSRLAERSGRRGAMAVVALSATETERLAGKHGGGAVVAARNSPVSTVLSGDEHTIRVALAELERRGVFGRRIQVGFAAHSPHMDTVTGPLHDRLNGISPQPAHTAIHSAMYNCRVAGPELDASYWADHLRRPTLFADAIATVAAEQPTAFLEISPDATLTASMRECLRQADVPGTVATSLYRSRPQEEALADALAELYMAGADVRWSDYYPGSRTASVTLPPYPWQRHSFWFTPASGTPAPVPEGGHSQTTVRPGNTEGRRACPADGDGKVSIQTAPDLIPGKSPASGNPGRPAATLAPGSPVSAADPGSTPAPVVTAGKPGELEAQVAAILQLPAGRLPRDRQLRSLGLDSLMAVELAGQLSRWGLSIPPADLLGDVTLQSLAARAASLNSP